jgi:hypothetical protein
LTSIRTTCAFLFALVGLCLGVVTLSAQGPTSAGQSGIPYVDNLVHAIPANSSQLYGFDYSLDYLNNARPVTTIKLLGAYNSGVNFEVWTASGVADIANGKPIGRGSSVPLDCDSGLPRGSGQCMSPDLNWSGAFGTSGPYYIKVVNANSSLSQFQLSIEGTGVSLATPTTTGVGTLTSVPTAASGPVAPSAAPTTSGTVASTVTPTTAAVVNADDPNRAVTIDGQPHSLAAQSAIWYRFDYVNNHMTGKRPRITITLVNGLGSGVDFQVYAPENISGWWNNHPTGRGTMEMIDCATGEPSESGECQSPDLIWQGNFGADGTYWVRIVNNNSNQVDYTLTFSETQPAP